MAVAVQACQAPNKWKPFSDIYFGEKSLSSYDFCALKDNPNTSTLLKALEANDELPFRIDDKDRKYGLETALSITVHSQSQEACETHFSTGAKNYGEKYETLMAKNKSEWVFPLSEDAKIRGVQDKIIELAMVDQAARTSWISFEGDSSGDLTRKWSTYLAGTKIGEIDKKSLAYMKTLLSHIDWVDAETYGEYPSFFAWLLVQHADGDPEFQKMVLSRLRPYLKNGEVSRSDYAYLADRVAVNTGSPQIYGTQSTGNCVKGIPEMRPISNPDGLDIRRKEMELGAHASYLKQLARTVCKND